MNKTRISKAVIFAGGEGTRLAEKTELTPKPLVCVGPDPIIIHIMRHLYSQGIREFIIAVGYKSEQFKEYFQNYSFSGRSVTFTSLGKRIHGDPREDWTVHVVETGRKSTTGQRLNAVAPFIKDDDFFLTYGDSHSDVDLTEVEKVHYASGKTATITAVSKDERFGVLNVTDDGEVKKFSEKSSDDAALINGGFIACKNSLLESVNENSDDFSYETLTRLADEGEIGYYHHRGFWQAMDTKRDLDKMNKLYVERPELFN